MERYDSYKDSGVEWIGNIPSHWERKRFSYSFNIQKGKIPKELEDVRGDESLPYLSMSVLRGEEPNEFSSGDGLVIVDINDIGLLWDGSNSGEVLKVNQRGILSSTVSHVSLKDINLTKGFSFYLLKVYEKDFKNNTVGMGIPHVDGDHVKESKILIPPISEQQQIVSFLDTKTSLIDSLIEKTQRKIELLKEKRTSLINEVVTKGLNPNVEMKDSGVEWVGEIPSHWEKISLGKLGVLYGGLTGKSGDDFRSDDHPSNKPFIPFTNIFNNTYISKDHFQSVVVGDDENQNRVEKFDLFFLMSSEDYDDLGKSSILIEDVGEVYLNSFCKGFRVNRTDVYPLFLNYQLLGDTHKKLISIEGNGFTRINLRQDRLKETPMFIPPLYEQQQIVSHLDEQTQLIDKTISMEEKRIELLQEYRQSLISEVVTGKRKVV